MSKIKLFIIMVWNDFIHIFIDNNPHYYVNAKTYERFLEWEQNNDR